MANVKNDFLENESKTLLSESALLSPPPHFTTRDRAEDIPHYLGQVNNLWLWVSHVSSG